MLGVLIHLIERETTHLFVTENLVLLEKVDECVLHFPERVVALGCRLRLVQQFPYPVDIYEVYRCIFLVFSLDQSIHDRVKLHLACLWFLGTLLLRGKLRYKSLEAALSF